MKNLANQLILITGASSGIGQACARQCAALGARIILCARRTERLEDLAEEIKQNHNSEVWVLTLDVRERMQVKTKLASLPKEWRDIDVLINNAGLALDTLPIAEGMEDHWDTMIDTNIKGLLYVTKAILPGMLARSKGHIVNLGSMAGYECYPNGNVYCATKHAVRALSKSMRLDLLGSAIRVTEIAPGAVDTEFSSVRWNDEARARAFYDQFTPLNAEDVADSIIYSITRPPHVNIEQLLIMPTVQASPNHLFKNKNR